jgi:nicotinamide mononucleotide (NMN) deamidase PncC
VWIAVQIGEEVRAQGRVYIGDRGEVRSRSAQAALDTVRRMLTQPL